jgi:chromosome segregation ATPase
VQKLGDDITASEKVDSDQEGVLNAYKDALAHLISDYKDAHTYSDTKMRMILCAIEKKKPEIDQKIAQYDQQIAQKTAAVEQLKAAKAAAEQQLNQAQKDKEQKDNQYKYWHDLQSNDEKKLQDIKDLKKQIEEEDEASHPASMYFLALELERVLKSIQIVSIEELKYRLGVARAEQDKANETVRNRTSDLAQATSTLNTEQSDLDQLKEKRRENILAIVATCDEPPDQQKKAQATK